MRPRDRTDGYVNDLSGAGGPRRHGRPGKRLPWRDIVVSSKLYGRSRWLHSPGKDEAGVGEDRLAGED